MRFFSEKKNIVIGLVALLVLASLIVTFGNSKSKTTKAKADTQVITEAVTAEQFHTFKTQFEFYNNVKYSNGTETYISVNIPTNNTVTILDSYSEAVSKLVSEDEFILYFGAPSCPYCREEVEALVQYGIDNDLPIYYLDVFQLGRTEYEFNGKGTAYIQTNVNEEYERLLSSMNIEPTTEIMTNKDGEEISVSRVYTYAPSCYLVNNGVCKELTAKDFEK